MTEAEKLKAMALIFERKADACAASSVPWALNNLRLYQNKASEFWGKHFSALKAELRD